MKVRCTCGRKAQENTKPFETFEGWATEVYFACRPCNRIGQRVRGMHKKTVRKIAAGQFVAMCKKLDAKK